MLSNRVENHRLILACLYSFSSFVESHGQPLVDLSLYVSSENYTTATRGAYSEILQWPGQWITPPKLRAVAKLRSEHLGLSSLDLDSADLPETASEGPRAVQIPRSLVTRPKETVSSFFSKAANRSQFRLSTIASQFHEPLQELLGGAEYFFTSTSPSSLDCLVLGYLALALHPRLPHEWLRDSLTEKFSDLRYFTETFGRQCFGPVVTVRDAFLQTSVDHNEPKGKTVDASLPWKAPEQASIAVMGSTILENMADSTPVLREMRAHSRMQQASKNPHLDEEESRSLEKIAKQGRNETYSQIAFAVVSVSAFVGYLFHEGLISVRRSDEENQTEKRDFGDAGSLLGI